MKAVLSMLSMRASFQWKFHACSSHASDALPHGTPPLKNLPMMMPGQCPSQLAGQGSQHTQGRPSHRHSTPRPGPVQCKRKACNPGVQSSLL
jgi:hypothetical protein